MLGTYVGLTAASIYALRNRGDRVPKVGVLELVMLGLATQHATRLISKDTVTAPLRAPFTEFEGAAGEGEVNERVIGTGLRHSIGELLACPFCLGQWAATGLVAGSVAAPRLGTAAVTTLAAAQLSDYLQLAYAALRHRQ